ncbi:MAG TPA: GNAT family N-acetyltransferase [Pyrinomonadaceae bacterium]|nr:GNAT family N-acetyltransferase [Pyrinomonadaceae bacterium]
MIIRRASPEDSSTLTQIAHDAKKHWGYPDHWIQHWRDDLTISADFIGSNPVYVAEHEGTLVGFYALVVRQDKAVLDHLWVTPNHIGSGIGKQLFLHAMQGAAGQSVSAVEISSDPHAEGFYQKMGAHRLGETVSEIDGQPRILPLLEVDPRSK